MSCNDENGKPMDFASGDVFSGKINIEYYFQGEGLSMKRRLIGNIYIKAS